MFLCGDVMTGRGVDQILPHPGDPRLREDSIGGALGYVALAEAANGPIPRPADPAWPWGDALAVLADVAPDVRLINLETSITRSGDFAPGKLVHYRMNPANVACLTVARPDVCALANNHVLDLGRSGLAETLETLAWAGLRAAGACRDCADRSDRWSTGLAGGGRMIPSAAGRLVRYPARMGGSRFAARCGPASPPVQARGRPGRRAGPGGQAARRPRGGLPALGIELGLSGRPGSGRLRPRSSMAGWTWSTATRHTTRARSRCTAASSSCTAAGTSSTTTRASPASRSTGPTGGCCPRIAPARHRRARRAADGADAGTQAAAAARLRPGPAWLAATLDRVSRRFGTRVELAPDGVLVLHPRQGRGRRAMTSHGPAPALGPGDPGLKAPSARPRPGLPSRYGRLRHPWPPPA